MTEIRNGDFFCETGETEIFFCKTGKTCANSWKQLTFKLWNKLTGWKKESFFLNVSQIFTLAYFEGFWQEQTKQFRHDITLWIYAIGATFSQKICN
jgi:hypothetical protein